MYNWNQFNRRQTDSTFSNEKRKENYGWNPEEVLLLLLADKGPRDSCVNFVISLVLRWNILIFPDILLGQNVFED